MTKAVEDLGKQTSSGSGCAPLQIYRDEFGKVFFLEVGAALFEQQLPLIGLAVVFQAHAQGVRSRNRSGEGARLA